METFLQYWKKGWKVLLMIVCVSLANYLWIIPAVIPVLNSENKEIYSLLITIIFVIISPAIAYFIFKLFYGEQS